jgi:hypothetical protein
MGDSYFFAHLLSGPEPTYEERVHNEAMRQLAGEQWRADVRAEVARLLASQPKKEQTP